jgi:hypothetical protein
MNCSQLLERRAHTNWEKPVQTVGDPGENPAAREIEPGRWNAVRFSSVAQTFSPWVAPTFKPSSN